MLGELTGLTSNSYNRDAPNLADNRLLQRLREAFSPRKLRAAGDSVIATGRSADVKLAHLKDTGGSILDLDVSTSGQAIKAKIDDVWSLYSGGIDVVVNNAGYILSGALEALT